MKPILVTLGLVLSLSAATVRADGNNRGLTPPARQGVVVPFELLKTKHITVKVKLNGKGPFRVIFDTGAPVNLINNRAARESGMVSAQETPSLFSLFGSMGE
ncbi:MAG: aspartyl protease family protein, partial [Planctomycetes bacterium]|nr:aspartyl protease family protein [Planctomycetota bacterium]